MTEYFSVAPFFMPKILSITPNELTLCEVEGLDKTQNEHIMILMETIVLLLILASLVLQQVVFALFFTRARHKIALLEDQMMSFVSPAAEGQPSPLAKLVDVWADMIARAIMAQAKTFLAGVQSGVVRSENAQAEQAQLTAMPLLSAVPKNFRRNPLINIFTQILASKIGGSPGASPGASPGNGNERPKFRF